MKEIVFMYNSNKMIVCETCYIFPAVREKAD